MKIERNPIIGAIIGLIIIVTVQIVIKQMEISDKSVQATILFMTIGCMIFIYWVIKNISKGLGTKINITAASFFVFILFWVIVGTIYLDKKNNSK